MPVFLANESVIRVIVASDLLIKRDPSRPALQINTNFQVHSILEGMYYSCIVNYNFRRTHFILTNHLVSQINWDLPYIINDVDTAPLFTMH